MEVEHNAMRSFLINFSHGSVRAGILKNVAQEIETPSCVIHSKFGLPAYLSADLLKNIPSRFSLHLSVQDMYVIALYFT